MTLIVHSPDSLALASRRVFDAALPTARDGGAAGLVVVVVDGADRVHYHTSMRPTMTAGMLSSGTLPQFDDDELGVAAGKAHAAASPVADEHCVGFALVVIADDEGTRVRSSMGPVMTAGMLRRAAGLFDITHSTSFAPFLSGAGTVVGDGQTTATGAALPVPSDEPPTV